MQSHFLDGADVGSPVASQGGRLQRQSGRHRSGRWV